MPLGGGLLPVAGHGPDTWLFQDLPAHIYHADRQALSCSLMKPLLVSPAHFQVALTAVARSSPAKTFGSLLHLLLLQPQLAGQELAVFPGVAEPRSGQLAQFIADHPDKLVTDEPTFARARRLVQKTADTLYRGRPLARFIEESMTEATVYFIEPVTGLRMRVRLDAYHPDISFDLKSTRHPSARAFTRDAVDYDYDLQAYMYSLGRCLFEGSATAKPFVFIAAESEAPHSVSTLSAGSAFMESGEQKFQACVSTFKACTATNFWPDLSCDGEIVLEPWQQFSLRNSWQAAMASTDSKRTGNP